MVYVLAFVKNEQVSSQKDHLDIYSDPKFAYFISIFDSILKELHQNGVHTSKKQDIQGGGRTINGKKDFVCISKRLCNSIGIQGNFTNHSLPCTCPTRLYQHGAGEQL